MAQEAIRLVTPVGRVVWGSVYERQTEDYDGNKYNPGEGPFQFGLAVLKSDPAIGQLLTALYQQAIGGYQNNAQIVGRINNEWQSGFTSGMFRFKIKDGDQPNSKGLRNPNTAGCYVFALQTTLPIKCGNAQNAEIDPKAIKTGYFVDIAVSAKVNDKVDGTAGIYINPQVVRLIAFGEEITGGPSVEEAFAGHAAPTALPPGASLTPKAPTSEPGAGLPGMGGGQMTPNGGAPLPGQTMGNAPGATMQHAGTVPMQGQGGYVPQQGIPATGYPSNPPIPGQMGNAPGGQNGMSGLATGYPINPQTGQPVQPHQQFVGGPGLPGQ